MATKEAIDDWAAKAEVEQLELDRGFSEGGREETKTTQEEGERAMRRRTRPMT